MNKVHQILHKRVHIKAWTCSQLGFDIHQGENIPVGGLCDDSRAVKQGDTFLCLPRAAGQARDFIQQAIHQGATAVIVVGERIPCPLPCLYLSDMAALGLFLRRYFDTMETATCCVGVTGTDGKTSVAWMLRHALARHLGVAWSSGTLGWVRSSEETYELGNTTPSLLTMHRLLAAAHQAQMPAWVMEVSSHGIEQERLAGLPFDAAVWTTLGHDHLQDHGGFECYAGLKTRFMNQVMSNGGLAVVNAHQAALIKRLQGSSWKGYMPKGAHLDVSIAGRLHQSDMMVWETLAVGQVGLQCHGQQVVVDDVPVGLFHAENLAAVAQVLKYQFKMDLPSIASCLRAMPAPYGRMETVKNTEDLQVYIDYAHTPEGLQACLKSGRSLTQANLLLVFGCGGNRDVSKRAEMGAVAEAYADEIWLTSDNPRDEEPENIMGDILKGMHAKRAVHQYLDRGDAIADALQVMKVGDVLIIAGKGHENYMEIKGKRTAWHDATWVRQCLLDDEGQETICS
ncbi:MAG: UDP-N-acetylmuramoyl-L-alanyl-D-glutamate--2,6-diaminopimelate ligase [Zetaproteobacteria bacterium]|nr:UDP-N-acetylmuramoyl-L-alanyl-D-glutamate--2,6-diaminopimelate ligase [Zetaproteobacteria bacterium]